MNRKVLSSMLLFTVFLVSVISVSSVVATIEPGPGETDVTIKETLYFVKGYMKHGLTFDLSADYYGVVNVDATFTHFRSGREFTFNFEDILDGRWYTFLDMKKMPSGLYDIVIHITGEM